MIINKKTKMVLTRSDKPNENWTNQDCYVVEDSSELANKILDNYPYIEYVIDNDNIVDVTILPKDEPDIPVSPIEQLRADIDYLALMTEVDL